MRKGLFAICSILLVLVVSLAVLAPSCTPTTGTIEVKATLDGSPWPSSGTGAVDYTLTGPGTSPTGTDSVPKNFTVDPGSWTCAYISGGPPDTNFVDITTSATQSVTAGGTITFTLNFETIPPLDASITFVSWTIDGQQVPPGSYTVYPPTIIDCEYGVFVAGNYCELVTVNKTFQFKYHFKGEAAYKTWHVANAPGCVYTIPPATNLTHQASVNGVVHPICYSFKAWQCEPVTLDVIVSVQLHKGVQYTLRINWLGFKGSGPENIVFDTQAETPGEVGISDMVTSGCVHVDGDVNPANDCTGDSEPLYITHNYTGT